MRSLALALIRVYQNYFSWLNGPSVCRFYPRCSQYCYEAVAKHGVVKGGLMGLTRVLKCHPGHVGGVDIVR